MFPGNSQLRLALSLMVDKDMEIICTPILIASLKTSLLLDLSESSNMIK